LYPGKAQVLLLARILERFCFAFLFFSLLDSLSTPLGVMSFPSEFQFFHLTHPNQIFVLDLCHMFILSYSSPLFCFLMKVPALLNPGLLCLHTLLFHPWSKGFSLKALFFYRVLPAILSFKPCHGFFFFLIHGLYEALPKFLLLAVFFSSFPLLLCS